ncbi:anchored repeat ABC transporter, substrate-binding protein [Arcanobacterium hippocoleae]|uniref:anchored repeat ABC transporter, substrate-binding protein n=1 Tax=Arcanobacterium hippocoleae TaxID=149017 RepID=UPI003341650B
MRRRSLAAIIAGTLMLVSCAAMPLKNAALATTGGGQISAKTESAQLKIVSSTPIIADFVQNVAPEAEISTLVPPGADPHTYEPSLAAIRDVARADIAFSNQLLLEEQSLLKTIDANLPDGAKHIGLGNEAVKFGARHIQLVEDASLSTVWLGFRVDGAGGQNATVEISAIEANGPGVLAAFTTGTFGQPSAWITSSDGIDPSEDRVELPTNAHTHMSWGFSAPGEYQLTLKAVLKDGRASKELGVDKVRFIVGKEPQKENLRVIDSGHVDITAKLAGGITLLTDNEKGGKEYLQPSEVVFAVPYSSVTTIPSPEWGFLARPGQEAFILAQAVAGRHVHGEIDPHLWHDVKNAIAYVETIREELVQLDPQNAKQYQENAERYISQLHRLDQWMSSVLASIPSKQRTLVTTHDAFGYLARAYGLKIAGFVAPNPSLEPSVQQLANLARTLQNIGGRAVFIEPNARTHVNELLAVAQQADVKVCTIYADTFTREVDSYLKLMTANAKSLKGCLDPGALPAWDFPTDPKLVQ